MEATLPTGWVVVIVDTVVVVVTEIDLDVDLEVPVGVACGADAEHADKAMADTNTPREHRLKCNHPRCRFPNLQAWHQTFRVTGRNVDQVCPVDQPEETISSISFQGTAPSLI